MLATKKLFLKASCLSVIGLLAGPAARAATIHVPADQSTISAAIAAATNGDTIDITNSANYIEALDVNKTLTIMADSGQTPTIQSPTGSPAEVVYIRPDVGGQFGSSSGGTININGTASDSSKAVDCLDIAGSAVLTTFQNLHLAGSSSYIIQTVSPNAVVQQQFTDITADGAGPISNYIIRPQSYEQNCNITYTRCTFLNSPFQGFYLNQGYGRYTFDNCKWLNIGHEMLFFDTSAYTGPTTFTMKSSIVDSGNSNLGYQGLRVQNQAGNNMHIILDHTVIYSDLDGSTYQGDNTGCSSVFTHCDFASHYTGGTGRRGLAFGDTSTAESIVMTDCNIIPPTVTPNWGIRNSNAAITSGVIANYCNIIGTTQTLNVTVNHAISPVSPTYANEVGDNFTYNNATLLTGSSTGDPVGTDRDLSAAMLPVELSGFAVE